MKDHSLYNLCYEESNKNSWCQVYQACKIDALMTVGGLLVGLYAIMLWSRMVVVDE